MIVLALGSNLGHRLHYLQQAVDILRKKLMPDLCTSIVLETEALLPPNAPSDWNIPFLNMLVWGTYTGDPEELLQAIKSIERDLGRPEVTQRWSPRVMDIDILTWDGITLNQPHLSIPHQGLMDRPFLLHLLALHQPYQIAPNDLSWNENAMKCTMPVWSRSMVIDPKLVGIVNITPDSFSDGGLYTNVDTAVQHVWQLVEDGATVVDIGAQSTRPGAPIISVAEEWSRLKPVLDALQSDMKQGNLCISVDTFQKALISQLLNDYDIAWVNDVTGRLDDETLRQVADKGCKMVAMHALSVPVQSNEHVSGDPIKVINQWIENQESRWQQCGLPVSSVILDPGLGFGKSTYQNIDIMRRIEGIQSNEHPLLIGHSRKSWISALGRVPAFERDVETMASSLVLDNIDYLRVHNVRDHMRALVTRDGLA